MRYALSRKSFVRALALIVLLLTAMGVAGQYSKFVLGHESLFGLVQLFDLDKEITIPSLYQSSSLLLCSLLLAVIALAERRRGSGDALHWAALSVIFLLLTLEEAARWQHYLVEPLRVRAGLHGWFYSVWVVLVAASGVFFFKFFFRLPARVRLSFLCAFALLWGGGVGLETINLRYAQAHGGRNIIYALLTAGEELLEMAGVVAFIDGLLYYIGTELGEVTVAFGD